jgi:hypothetical protein
MVAVLTREDLWTDTATISQDEAGTRRRSPWLQMRSSE